MRFGSFFTSVLIFTIYNLAHINEQKRIKIKEKFKPPFGNKCRFSRDDIESGRHFKIVDGWSLFKRLLKTLEPFSRCNQFQFHIFPREPLVDQT